MRSLYASPLFGAALAIAALILPAPAAADTCPPGQSGTPPYCANPPPPPPTCAAGQVGTPPNCVTPTFSVKSTRVAGLRLTIGFEVNAAGTLTVSGDGVASKSVDVVPGQVKVRLSLTSEAKQALKKQGKVKLKLSAVYQPTAADPQTEKLRVVVRKPGKRHRHHG